MFDILINGPSVRELTDAGHLVPAQVYAPSKPDLAGVKVERGDYVESQLSKVMDTPVLVGDIVTHWHKLAENRPTVVFATGVAHSIHLRDEFRGSGVMAEHIDGGTPIEERDTILAKLAKRQIDVVSNAMVLTEGWDAPLVAALVLARPTKSLGLYRQMVGRVLRPAPRKIDALILDHAGCVYQHGFPDDAIEWSLSGNKRAENKAQSSRQAGHAPKLTDCPECHAVRFEGKPCSFCGWRPVSRGHDVDVIDGELGEVGRDRRVQQHFAGLDERRRWHSMLTYIANDRGFKPGWAAFKFKEKFGDWPATRSVQPVMPEAEVLSWVRSRQIAYAKAMAKQRGAA